MVEGWRKRKLVNGVMFVEEWVGVGRRWVVLGGR